VLSTKPGQGRGSHNQQGLSCKLLFVSLRMGIARRAATGWQEWQCCGLLLLLHAWAATALCPLGHCSLCIILYIMAAWFACIRSMSQEHRLLVDFAAECGCWMQLLWHARVALAAVCN
jgi:hypothetical protein